MNAIDMQPRKRAGRSMFPFARPHSRGLQYTGIVRKRNSLDRMIGR
jgi:hypothetical protein